MPWPNDMDWMHEHPNLVLNKTGPTHVPGCDCRIDSWLRQYRWCDTHGPDGIARTHDSYMGLEFEMRRMDILKERKRQKEANDLSLRTDPQAT